MSDKVNPYPLTPRGFFDLPKIIPNDMNEDALFNAISDLEPIKSLAGKDFKIKGMFTEVVQVPRKKATDADDQSGGLADGDGEDLVDRQRLTLITDVGVFASYSITFAAAIKRAIDIFGDNFQSKTFHITVRLTGSGDKQKAFYIVKTVPAAS